MQGNTVLRKFSEQRANAGTPPTCMKLAGEILRLDSVTVFTYLNNNNYHADSLLKSMIEADALW